VSDATRVGGVRLNKRAAGSECATWASQLNCPVPYVDSKYSWGTEAGPPPATGFCRTPGCGPGYAAPLRQQGR
jgi:hypothetical protein